MINYNWSKEIHMAFVHTKSTSPHLRTDDGIIWSSGAASINDCHVFMDSGITNPKSKNHSETNKHFELHINDDKWTYYLSILVSSTFKTFSFE